MIQIGVIGGHKANRKQLEWARLIGQFIARIPAVMVCGGLGGVMEAASRGAREAGGMTVGVLPGDDRKSANKHIGIRLPTGMGVARNVIIIRSADLVFAIGGGPGTLSEIAYAMQLGVPVVGLDTWDVDARIMRANSPEEAMQIAQKELGVGSGG